MERRLRRVIQERQLHSLMNRTRWRALCRRFEDLHDKAIAVRYKSILEDQPCGFGPVWWHEMFEFSPQIEWLDFDPMQRVHRGQLVPDGLIDRREIINKALRAARIPYAMEGSYYRVWGYVEAGEQPAFVLESETE